MLSRPLGNFSVLSRTGATGQASYHSSQCLALGLQYNPMRVVGLGPYRYGWVQVIWIRPRLVYRRVKPENSIGMDVSDVFRIEARPIVFRHSEPKLDCPRVGQVGPGIACGITQADSAPCEDKEAGPQLSPILEAQLAVLPCWEKASGNTADAAKGVASGWGTEQPTALGRLSQLVANE